MIHKNYMGFCIASFILFNIYPNILWMDIITYSASRIIITSIIISIKIIVFLLVDHMSIICMIVKYMCL